MSFLLDWNPGIGDRERGAQPLVEFSRRLSAVPSAPGERACFVFGAGRDHQAQSGLGVLDVPVLSLWRVRRHGDLPCGCPSGTPALRRSPPCVSWTVPFGALRRFASHPHRGARGRPVRFGCIVVSFLVLVIVVTVRSIVVLYRESSPDYVARGAAARAVRRGVRRGEFRAPVTLCRPVERVSGAALTDSGGYRIKGGVSRAVRRTWVCIGSICPIAFRTRLQRQLHGEVCVERGSCPRHAGGAERDSQAPLGAIPAVTASTGM